MTDTDTDTVADDEGNRVAGARTRQVVEHLASFLVEDEDALEVTVDERGPGEVEVLISAGPGDVGRIIGRRGRVIQAIRQVARAAASTESVKANVEIADE